jgi:hypothetical protein
VRVHVRVRACVREPSIDSFTQHLAADPIAHLVVSPGPIASRYAFPNAPTVQCTWLTCITTGGSNSARAVLSLFVDR